MKRALATSSAVVLAIGVGMVGATANADPTQPDEMADALSMAMTNANSFVKSDDANLFVSSDDKMESVNATTTLGMTFVEYERSYKGLPVVGGDAVVATDLNGKVQYAATAQNEQIDLETIKPKISASQAQDTVGAKASSAELVVLAWEDPALAYASSVKTVDEDGAPIERMTFVDAMNGEKLTSVDTVFSGTGNTYYNGQGSEIEFGTSEGGDGFVMEDPDRPGLSCAEEGGDVFTKAEDVWGDGTGTDLETACVDAMYAAGTEWDMLAEWVDRDGIDGEGGTFPIYVGLDQANAYWDGSSTHFGHSSDNERQATTMDVVGHEFGHGIFENTPGGSMGGNETGGINEAAGDIFGTMTEWYAGQPNEDGHDAPDYLVGEEVGLATADEPIRNMADPGQFDHPACWTEDIPNTEVHEAAGPMDHWFYLLAEGTEAGGDGVPGSETCDGSTIAEGLGPQVAGQIWMGAMMSKTSSWTYTEARTAALEFAASSDKFDTCAEYDATKTAFDAVEVPAGEDPTCSK